MHLWSSDFGAVLVRFGKMCKKNTGFGQLATALAARVPGDDGRGGEIANGMPSDSNRLLADLGRPFLVHAVVWYVLFVGILSGHKWKSHPTRVLLNTPTLAADCNTSNF